MSTVFATYLITGLTAGAGFAAVFFPLQLMARWYLHCSRTAPAGQAVDQQEPHRATLEPEQAQQLVTRLHDVAMRLTQDVGRHDAEMREVNTELQGVDAGDGDKALETVLRAVDRIAQANGQLSEQLTSAQETIRKQSELLESQMEDALTDPLTEIANRRAFNHELDRRYADWKRRQTPVSLLMLDVDHFKRFNDQYGHQAGDEVLRGVAHVLSEAMREMDLVARFGGEEFTVILPDTDLNSAKDAAERARRAVAEHAVTHDNTTLHVTTSVGLATLRSGDQPSDLISRSDEALYASKEAGRNCAHYHDGKRKVRIGGLSRSKGEAVAAPEPAGASQSELPAPLPSPAPPNNKATEPVAPAASGPLCSDPLTGLPTRLELIENLRRRLAEKRRHNVPVALATFQLDDFERIMELGTRASEFVVDASARILEAASREMDLVVRTGASQFAIMFPGCDLAEAIAPAERVRNAIAACDKLRRHGVTVPFTTSVGIAEALDEEDATALLERTEAAMRQAIARGSNRTFIHNGITCESLSAMERLLGC